MENLKRIKIITALIEDEVNGFNEKKKLMEEVRKKFNYDFTRTDILEEE